jgi:hypothetical protein
VIGEGNAEPGGERDAPLLGIRDGGRTSEEDRLLNGGAGEGRRLVDMYRWNRSLKSQ